MVQIPASLMISPPNAYADKDIGKILRESKDILPGIILLYPSSFLLNRPLGDLLLALYVMYEINKKEESFFYPYLKILPVPESLSLWSDSELSYLQVA